MIAAPKMIIPLFNWISIIDEFLYIMSLKFALFSADWGNPGKLCIKFIGINVNRIIKYILKKSIRTLTFLSKNGLYVVKREKIRFKR